MKPQELNSFEFRLEVVSRRGSIAKQPHQLGNGDCIYGGLGKSGAWESPGPGPVVDLPLDLALDWVIDPDFAGWRLSTRQLTTEAATRRDPGH